MVSITAPAKINLTLEVLGRRDDGFHEIRSLAIGVDLCDRLHVRNTGDGDVTLVCNDASLANRANLAHRAAALLAQRLDGSHGAAIELDKRIPLGGGMGGGSSDAASVLVACNTLWNAGLSSGELAAIGAELGSDVPLFFSLPAVVMTGRGERVEPVEMRWSGWVLLALIDEFVSSEKVYAGWREEDESSRRHDRETRLIEACDAAAINELASNDLQSAVCRNSPRVANVLASLRASGLGPLHVSGAGSTLFRLFDEREEALAVARSIKTAQPGVRTTVVAAPGGPGRAINEESD